MNVDEDADEDADEHEDEDGYDDDEFGDDDQHEEGDENDEKMTPKRSLWKGHTRETIQNRFAILNCFSRF